MKTSPLPQPLPKECIKAAKIFQSFVDRGNNGLDGVIPRSVLEGAKGFAIFTIFKAGFLFSARAGSGLVIAKLDDGTWSAPSAIGTAGLGFGSQAGAEVTDFLVVLNTRSALKSFMAAGSLTLGGNMSIAVGPMGRNGEAMGSLNTGGKVAAMYSYSRTKGLFGGLSIEGSVIVERQDANAIAYESDVTVKQLLSGAVPPPSWARSLISTLEACTGLPGTRKWIEDEGLGSTPPVDGGYAFDGIGTPVDENGPGNRNNFFSSSFGKKKKKDTFPPPSWGQPKREGSYFADAYGDQEDLTRGDPVAGASSSFASMKLSNDRPSLTNSASASKPPPTTDWLTGSSPPKDDEDVTKNWETKFASDFSPADVKGANTHRSSYSMPHIPTAQTGTSASSYSFGNGGAFDTSNSFGGRSSSFNLQPPYAGGSSLQPSQQQPTQFSPTAYSLNRPTSMYSTSSPSNHLRSQSHGFFSPPSVPPPASSQYVQQPISSTGTGTYGGGNTFTTGTTFLSSRSNTTSPPVLDQHDMYHRATSAISNTGNSITRSGTASTGVPHLAVKPGLESPLSPREGVARAVALYDFKATESGDLSFKKGDVIVITQKSQSTDDWWTGKVNGGMPGIFPANFVELVP